MGIWVLQPFQGHSADSRVGFKYIFWNQIQIQLGQIKYKYIAFPDFNTNTNFQFKYKYATIFIQIRFKYIAICEIWFKYIIQILTRVSIIVQVYHSG